MVFDKRVYVEKLEPTASNADKSGYASHPGFPLGVMINIQPASATLTALAEGELFKTYKAFVTASGIVENFRLTMSGTGDQFIVRGREPYTLPMGQHYELLLVKPKI